MTGTDQKDQAADAPDQQAAAWLKALGVDSDRTPRIRRWLEEIFRKLTGKG